MSFTASVATSSTSGLTETFVLEGTWSINDNEEKWEYLALPANAVARKTSSRDNVRIISDTIADLKINRREALGIDCATAIAAAGSCNGSTSGSRSRSGELMRDEG